MGPVLSKLGHTRSSWPAKVNTRSYTAYKRPRISSGLLVSKSDRVEELGREAVVECPQSTPLAGRDELTPVVRVHQKEVVARTLDPSKASLPANVTTNRVVLNGVGE